MGNFDKFTKKELTGARKKEAFREEKRQIKKEITAAAQAKKVSGKNPVPAAGLPAKQRKPERSAGTDSGKTHPKSAGETTGTGSGQMLLNKYIAHGGICSRRDAAMLVKSGKVLVNGKVVTNPSYVVQPTDVVKTGGKTVEPKKNLVYILLNKPKDFLTTASDEKGRKTVMDIIKNATTERVYPVGRLDRNTTGVLLLTNDGDLAQQLTHPKFEIRKIYEVKLDKPMTKGDLDKLVSGLELEDGPIAADAAAYADTKDHSVVGIEIHSGRNRIVRRMCEHLGYEVKNLDRVMFANLTKKNVERGKWRILSEKEVRLLKYFNKSKAAKKGDLA